MNTRFLKYSGRSIILLILASCLLFLPFGVLADQGKAVLIVSDRSNARMMETEKKILENLKTYRTEFGFDKNNLPLLIYDYSKPEVRSYVNSTLGISQQDLPCLSAVAIQVRTRGNVREEIPVRVLLKISRPDDPAKSVRTVLQHLKPPATSASTGKIEVTTQPPDVKVWFGKTYKGKTPLTISNAPPGKHTLTFVREGYEKTTREVMVEKGKTVSCSVQMPSTSGMLAIASQPAGGKVYIDGVYFGVTPININKIEQGKRRVVVVSGDKRWEREVVIEKGKTLQLSADIIPAASTPKPIPQHSPSPTPVIEGPAPESAGDVKDSFIPRGGQNGIFQVFVSNIDEVEKFKDYYNPSPGNKFVIIYLTQQNISDELQIYPGEFTLIDEKEASYIQLERLSNFWSTMLKPGGLKLGYIVFEIPELAYPSRLILGGKNVRPLTVNLE
jgi:hypothetical protein